MLQKTQWNDHVNNCTRVLKLSWHTCKKINYKNEGSFCVVKISKKEAWKCLKLEPAPKTLTWTAVLYFLSLSSKDRDHIFHLQEYSWLVSSEVGSIFSRTMEEKQKQFDIWSATSYLSLFIRFNHQSSTTSSTLGQSRPTAGKAQDEIVGPGHDKIVARRKDIYLTILLIAVKEMP